jgi:two-component system OmpR family sensor kinase
MRRPRSLQGRLGIALGILVTLLWIAAATTTAVILRREMAQVFDAQLRETAERLLPLAVVDLLGREEEGITQRLATIREHDELFTYVVRDREGRVLLQSHTADLADFPPYKGPGFSQTATHRLYGEEALQGSVRITVAEPLAHRAAIAREIRMSLGLPLLVVVPGALLAIFVAVRASFAPVRRFRYALGRRNERELDPVPKDGLPSEIEPVAAALNALLGRLRSAFEAERSFAANAAHELRTPLAGAIAQAQRLQTETRDEAAARRAADIEATLKQLARRAERLMQLARAEGARLRVDAATDLRSTVRIVTEDIARSARTDRIILEMPDRPVWSDIDPDAMGIVCRNMIENALRHGAAGTPVTVRLTPDGRLSVANDGPVVAADALARLADRFERLGSDADGSGLGLAIVAAIADRIGGDLVLRSPRPGQASGFEALVTLPVLRS